MPIIPIENFTDTLLNMGDITPNLYIRETNNYAIIDSVLIDNICFDSVELVKIDVQGWEINVINGMKNTIEKHKPTIIIEFEEHQMRKVGKTCKDLYDLIIDMGYYIFYLDYEYPSDHICVHKDNLDDFIKSFSDFIFEHTENNNINNNINLGISKKIKI